MASLKNILLFSCWCFMIPILVVASGTPGPITCPNNSTSVTVTLSEPASSVSVKCPGTGGTLKPAVESDGSKQKVFSDSLGKSEVELESLLPSGTITGSAENLTLSVSQLPSGSTTYYIQCLGGTSKSSSTPSVSCTFEVTTSAVSPTGPQICAVSGSTTNLEGKKGTITQFGCGANMNMYPTDLKKAFLLDCSSEVTLGTNMSLEASSGTKKLHAFTVEKTPSKPYTYCYKCAANASEPAGKSCMIMVAVSGQKGTSGSGRISYAAISASIVFIVLLLHLI